MESLGGPRPGVICLAVWWKLGRRPFEACWVSARIRTAAGGGDGQFPPEVFPGTFSLSALACFMIAIVDYQMGNLRSVQKGFEKVGFAAEIVSDPDRLRRAEKVVLPGVGAFRDAIGELRRRELVEPIREVVQAGKPFLGICLGLQLLFDVSYEDGEYEGMKILPGKVVRFQLPDTYKVPHMGWNQVHVRHRAPILQGLEEGTYFYFVHSYYVLPEQSDVIALEADYGGPFCAMVWRDNLYATQFHPEKSQAAGLRLLQKFAEL